VLNKIDIPDARELAELVRADLEARGLKVFAVSTKTGEGLQALTFAMADLVAARRAEAPAPAPARIIIRPAPVASGPEFTINKMGDGEGGFVWRVKGEKPERWVRQTDFTNPEAVGYLADRFTRIGIEEELLRLGAIAGDAVAIGGGDNPVVFDFAPQIQSGAEILARRGEDERLARERPAAKRRRELDADYHARKAESEAERATRLASYGLDADGPDWGDE